MKPLIYIVIRHSPLFWYANMAFTIFAPYLLLYFDKVFARSSANPFFCKLKATTSLILVKMLFMFCKFLIFMPYYDSTTDISTPREVITVIIILYSVGEAERKILIFSKKAVKLPRTCTIYIYIYFKLLPLRRHHR